MIIGAGKANREATIRLPVHGTDAQAQEVDAVIDTGFTGYLTLPSSLISALGLEWRGREEGLLADGSLQLFDVYAANVIWDGRSRTVETDATNTVPLIGMGLMYGHDLRIQVIEGGSVTIEALP